MKTMHRIFALTLALVLLTAGAALGEAFEAGKQHAIAAVQVSLPEAVVDYAVREHDDGRFEWQVFFTQNGQLGMCKVLETGNEVRRVELFNRGAGEMTASEAMAVLAQEKGAITVTELELDFDDGRLVYEGEAQLEGRNYEFEMTAAGKILEWERD